MVARFLDSQKIAVKRSDWLRATEICRSLYRMMPQLPTENATSVQSTTWTTGPVPISSSTTLGTPTPLADGFIGVRSKLLHGFQQSQRRVRRGRGKSADYADYTDV